MLSQEAKAKIDLWRLKASEGTLSIEEMREAVLLLRQGRMAAAESSTTAKKAKAKAEVKTASQMLGELL